MYTLSDYVEWVAKNLGIELDYNELSKLTIELVDCKKYNEGLNKLQDRIVEMSDAKHFSR